MSFQILPGTGRGTIRRMVVGAGGLTLRCVWTRAPTTTPLRAAVPLPVPGRITRSYICTRTPAMNTRPKWLFS